MTEEEAFRLALSRGAFAGMNPPKPQPTLDRKGHNRTEQSPQVQQGKAQGRGEEE